MSEAFEGVMMTAQQSAPAARLSLLFEHGERPSTHDAVRTLMQTGGVSASTATLREDAAGCIEVLASGLAFDLRGLAPGAAERTGEISAAYGFAAPSDAPFEAMEAAVLQPSAHVAGGAMMQPVLRAMLGLAANLAMRLPVKAVGWSAAGTLMEPGYFSLAVLNWLSGGPFPAHGLTALIPGADGSVTTRGLAPLIGKELHLEARPGETPEAATALAARLVDRLIRQGAPDGVREVTDGNERLTMEPSAAGQRIWVWRGR
jgi:hypothetical protein